MLGALLLSQRREQKHLGSQIWGSEAIASAAKKSRPIGFCLPDVRGSASRCPGPTKLPENREHTERRNAGEISCLRLVQAASPVSKQGKQRLGEFWQHCPWHSRDPCGKFLAWLGEMKVRAKLHVAGVAARGCAQSSLSCLGPSRGLPPSLWLQHLSLSFQCCLWTNSFSSERDPSLAGIRKGGQTGTAGGPPSPLLWDKQPKAGHLGYSGGGKQPDI